MLVLSRKVNETIILGENIRITVLQTGNQIRLGIVAPQEVSIRREELTQEQVATKASKRRTMECAAH